MFCFIIFVNFGEKMILIGIVWYRKFLSNKLFSD